MREIPINVPSTFAGEEWAGTYKIKELSAEERDKIDETVTSFHYDENAGRILAKIDNKKWRFLLVQASTTLPKDKKFSENIWKNMPPKLQDALFRGAQKLNYPTEEELRFLLKPLYSEDQTSG